LDYSFTIAPATLSIGGGAAVPIPATDTDFTTSDGTVINLTVSGVPAPLSGTFTAKAGISTDGGASMLDVSDFSATAASVRNSYDGTVLNIDVTGLTRTGEELVKHAGTFDTFTVLVTLRDLLKNRDSLPSHEVQSRIASLLTEIDSAHEGVLDGLRELGFRSSSMELLGGRVESLKVSRSESLSLVQDTDIADAILQLQRQDITYQAALQVSAKMIQTTLVGLLR
jgi:flagellar hook-associated protein 3 FlgL